MRVRLDYGIDGLEAELPDERVTVIEPSTPPAVRNPVDALLAENPEHAAADVTILIATGTHRANTDAELEEMLGRDWLGRCRVVNHDSRDRASLVDAGRTSTGVPVWLNRLWLRADVRITTGFVEPHFFAGFSGGPRLAAPGLGGAGDGDDVPLSDGRGCCTRRDPAPVAPVRKR